MSSRVRLLLSRAALVIITGASLRCAGEQHIHAEPSHLYAVDDPQFLRTMGAVGGTGIVGGNHVEAFQNGVEIFPPMLAAIRGAQRSITFLTYIYWSEEIGHEFANALAERSRSGVRVHVLVDWAGSGNMDEGDIETMERAGVEFRKFNPLRWYNIHRLNNRLHRKLLVVDGRIGFTGGVGIAGQWTGDAEDPEHWRDSHFRVEGPVVAQMQAVFAENWVHVTGKALHGAEYFPEIARDGGHLAQVLSSSPSAGSDSMEVMYLLAIAAAERSIYLSSSYFIPDEPARATILSALKRGVSVNIITPGPHMDAETVRRASRALWGDLLAAGARILEYQPTMFHCKMLVIDEYFVSVGSTNFDPRSFRLNDEANLNVYDAQFAREQIGIFEHDAANSRPISFDEWDDRPWHEKFIEWSTGILEPLL